MFFILVCFVSEVGSADTVIVTNGDRLTGKVKSMESGALIIETEYDPKIRIPWEQIQSLITDTPIFVKLHDGEELLGRMLESRAGGELRVHDRELGVRSLTIALTAHGMHCVSVAR